MRAPIIYYWFYVFESAIHAIIWDKQIYEIVKDLPDDLKLTFNMTDPNFMDITV